MHEEQLIIKRGEVSPVTPVSLPASPLKKFAMREAIKHVMGARSPRAVPLGWGFLLRAPYLPFGRWGGAGLVWGR